MDSTFVVVIAGAVAAGFVQGLSGFAFGLVATSIWAWWLPPLMVAPLSVFGALVGQLIAAATVRRGMHWHRLWPLLAGGLTGIPLGLLLLPRLDTPSFQLGIGLLLALWCPVMLFSGRIPRLQRGGRVADGAAGLLGGLTGAVAGFAGPIPTLWATLRGWERDTLRSVVQNFNLAMLVVTLSAYAVSGLVTREMWPLLPWVAGAVLLPVLLGARLYAGIGTKTFQRVVLALLALSGAALLLRALPPLLARLG
ncbi:MAG: sulfite exporter TauE/SafE family protein [Ideonella sp. WA131b]|jgi:hypothetical protein|nr:sulfite exporter TauE/SafE family protein [Ideonella sp. WA131b]